MEITNSSLMTIFYQPKGTVYSVFYRRIYAARLISPFK
ncbi:hypothetical protein EC2861200_4674 [Escherichia coli 2861200]|nr:hypothetical protein ECDEC6D_4776 [Escherichia coli DEC6D]EMV82010.1 hypothetical protein EC2861200_4674 [Escherichia coli 2861200]EZJ14630.1 hypothetical protein AD39_4619 [Escherichia coli 1-182-04_S4_C3]EZJ57910.1 hypothetical protein AC82_4376 [Escherichia coli 1-182-04_S4_C1]KDV78293.1 hypothetical protein AC42_4382 [Escherichia coli 2-052-05_S3_C3]KEM68519.1 hypothetical protein AB95_4694 [Escherichia coli 7-233-03_S3_C1]KEO05042.1 hypothetical protein AB37_4351 [Escherichia coli 8-4